MAKKKKTTKGSKKSTAAKAVGHLDAKTPPQLELESVERELEVARHEAETARSHVGGFRPAEFTSSHNMALREELLRSQEEAAEYEAYMSKKTERQQLKVQSISDRNQQAIDTVKAERDRKSKYYADLTKTLQDAILERERDLAKVTQQLEEMSELAIRETFRLTAVNLQSHRRSQEQEIAALEAEIDRLQKAHESELEQVKADLLHEKIRFQRDATQEVIKLEQAAAKEAIECLDEHSQNVRESNQQLRRQLVQLFSENKALREREDMLKKQHGELQRLLQLSAPHEESPRVGGLDATARSTGRKTLRGPAFL
ncbi:uncharacterized protein MONBRDRAFT_24705 [Monosiga brevicollis MX1]|uniref:DUF4515 domain-containing protein n=1 Tax=Monosiga brevicollis TaxID=81824 RepID=A9UX84_MONBE|nr:uncharacterized protein MONBRDRAFT_24705 [Monosiga brevicollis MX1]EDQ90344.1 predicted protein [Monosiga brevicollis MX1]|eukprot:XP_001745111.1 hypothetical protein [Monosiga brevicollis MX1]